MMLRPVIDVVVLASRGTRRAGRPDAPTVTDGDRDPLVPTEQPLLAPQIERAPRRIDAQDARTGIAEVRLDDSARKCRPELFVVTDARHPRGTTVAPRGESGGLDDDPHTGLPVAEGLRRVGVRARAQDGDQSVVLQLFVRALICTGVGRVRAGVRRVRVTAPVARHEPRPATRAEGGAEDRVHPQRCVVVEDKPSVMLAVLVDPRAERPRREALLEPESDSDRVESVTRDARRRAKSLDGNDRGLVDETRDRDRPRVGEELGVEVGIPLDGRFAQPRADRLELRLPESSCRQRIAQQRQPPRVDPRRSIRRTPVDPRTTRRPTRRQQILSTCTARRTSPVDCPVMFCTRDVLFRCPLRCARPW